MDLSLLSTTVVLTFLLILTRMGGMMASSPFFGNTGIPANLKVAASITFAVIFFPLHSGALSAAGGVPQQLLPFIVMMAQEFMIGLAIGFVAEMLFASIRMTGEFLAVQMGLSFSSVVDPLSGVQTPVLGQFYFIFAFLLFLSMNLHHALILGVERSFRWLPLGESLLEIPTANGGVMSPVAMLAERFLHLGSEMFTITLLVGLPVMGVLLASDVALGFVAKVMPQMNIFILGLPLKSAIGLLVIMVGLPFTATFLSGQYADLVQHVLGLFRHA